MRINMNRFDPRQNRRENGIITEDGLQMKNIFLKATAVSLILVMAMPVKAQEDALKDILKDMVSQNAEGYLMPLATALGSAFNSGTFHLGKPHKLLGFDFKVSVMYVEVPDIDYTYEFLLSDRVINVGGIPNPLGGGVLSIPLSVSDLYQSGVQVPSFMGKDDPAPDQVPVDVTKARTALISAIATQLSITTDAVELASGDAITTFVGNLTPLRTGKGFSPGIGGGMVPQFSVGLPFHTELTVRGFTGTIPQTEETIEMTGFGVKLGLNQFLPNFLMLMPALSVGYYQTDINIADIITMENTIINFQASKSLPFISVYAGYGMESSAMNIDLSKVVPGANLEPFSIDGRNKSRTTVGFRLKLLLISINGDISKGEYTTYTAGIGLTLR